MTRPHDRTAHRFGNVHSQGRVVPVVHRGVSQRGGALGPAARRNGCGFEVRSMRLIGAVMRLTEDGAALCTRRNSGRTQRYFVPTRELRGLRLVRGDLLTFRPARGASGSAIALHVRRYTLPSSADDALRA